MTQRKLRKLRYSWTCTMFC